MDNKTKRKWTLRKSYRFEASHQLVHHDGKCARLHGHSWILTVEISGYKLQQNSTLIEGMVAQELSIMDTDPPSYSVGAIATEITEKQNPKQHMLMDYSDISAIVKPYVDLKLDHRHLNETFGTDMPTSEGLAEQIYYDLRPHLHGLLAAIEIEETNTSFCRFELVEQPGSSYMDDRLARHVSSPTGLNKNHAL